MSKVDDELTRRLRRAERPVEDDGLFEGLARRRFHRERIRRVQAGMLALAVVAATAGGFLFLRDAFDADKRNVGDEQRPAVANGEIVFVKDGEDLRLHIYAARPDGSGERQITEGPTHDSDPAVSPDGRTVAFAHALDGDGGAVIATVPIEGGRITWETAEYHDVSDPTWSPDGTRIAFVGHTTTSADLYVADVESTDVRRIDVHTAARSETDGLFSSLVPSHPSWSPDGSWIAFAAMVSSDALPESYLAKIHPDGAAFEWLRTNATEFAPAWSPDGTQIAFLRASGGLEEIETTGGADEIWTIEPDGGSATLIATAVEANLGLDLDWAPDGTALLVSDHDRIYRVDPTPDGDPDGNFVQMMKGFAPSWQPLPAGSDPSPTPTPEPSVSPDPELAGHDIGLSFRLCHLHPLAGIDFLGDGAEGTAWTGSRLREDGTCSSPRGGDPSLLAVDVDGDRQADAFSEFDYCQLCRPFAAVDFDADGDDELALLTDGGFVSSFTIYSAEMIDGEAHVAPILVAPPGHPSASHQAGRPMTFSTGGDDGFSGWVRCEGFPSAPVLVTTWSGFRIEGDTQVVHETELVLGVDGSFHVINTSDDEGPVGQPVLGVSVAPACGVDWRIWE